MYTLKITDENTVVTTVKESIMERSNAVDKIQIVTNKIYKEQIDMTDENLELHSGNLGTAVRDLSELIIHKELIEDIMEIVSLYKQEWQEIFYMKCFEERTFQDISQTLNISENTVKSRFYKMIRQIKSEVDYQ